MLNITVANIRLSGDPECGHMRVLQRVKWINGGKWIKWIKWINRGNNSNSDFWFSMSERCQQCVQLLDKHVILITKNIPLEHPLDMHYRWFRLGKETTLILGVSPIQNCTLASNMTRGMISYHG